MSGSDRSDQETQESESGSGSDIYTQDSDDAVQPSASSPSTDRTDPEQIIVRFRRKFSKSQNKLSYFQKIEVGDIVVYFNRNNICSYLMGITVGRFAWL